MKMEKSFYERRYYISHSWLVTAMQINVFFGKMDLYIIMSVINSFL